MHKDEDARDAVEETATERKPVKNPPAGPHAENGLARLWRPCVNFRNSLIRAPAKL